MDSTYTYQMKTVGGHVPLCDPVGHLSWRFLRNEDFYRNGKRGHNYGRMQCERRAMR